MSSAESNEIVTFVVFKCAMSTVLHVMVGDKVPKKKKRRNICHFSHVTSQRLQLPASVQDVYPSPRTGMRGSTSRSHICMVVSILVRGRRHTIILLVPRGVTAVQWYNCTVAQEVHVHTL